MMNHHDENVGDMAHDEALRSVVEMVSRTMGLPACVWIPDQAGQNLQIAAAVGLPFSFVREASLSLDEVSVAGETYKTGEVTVSRDIVSDPRWKHKDAAQELGWKSLLSVPIRELGAVTGVIDVYTFVARDFSDLEVDQVAQFAAQIGRASEARRRGRVMGQLVTAGRQIDRLVGADPEAVAAAIVEQACALLEADCAILFGYDEGRGEFDDVARAVHHGLNNPLEPADRPRREGPAAHVVDWSGLANSDVQHQEPDLLRIPFVERENLKAVLGSTLTIGDRLLGVLYAGTRTPRQHSNEERDALLLFARQAALTLDYTMLYRHATEGPDVVKRLHDTTVSLLGSSGAPKDLNAVLTTIAENALGALGADLVDLYQYVQSKDEFVLPPIQVGERYVSGIPKYRVLEDDVLRDITRKRRCQYSIEAQREPILTQPYAEGRLDAPSERFVMREGVKSVAVMPLLVGSQLVGVLFVNYRTPQDFPRQQRELIELFAGQATVAMRNARQLESLRTVGEMARDITLIPEKDDLVQGIMNRVRGLLGADAAALFLLEKDTGQLSSRYRVGKSNGRTLALGEGLVGTVAQMNEPLRVGDVTVDPGYVQEGEEVYRSELDVPLRIDAELVGVLSVVSKRLDAFSQDDEDLAMAVANQAAVALYSADLAAQTGQGLGRRMDDIRVLKQVSESMDMADLNRLGALVTEKAVELSDAQRGEIRLADPTGTRLELLGLVGDERTVQEQPSLPINEHSIDGLVATTGQSYLCSDTRQDERHGAWHPDTRSQLTVPLRYQERTLGTLSVHGSSADQFSEDHRLLLETLAAQAATAIAHARSVAELEVSAAVGQWWARQQGPTVPRWCEELVELRARSLAAGETPRLELRLRDGKMLRGQWESFDFHGGRPPYFELSIRTDHDSQVIWITAANILEMDVMAADRNVKLIIGQGDPVSRGDHGPSQAASIRQGD